MTEVICQQSLTSWAIYVLQLFVNQFDVMDFETNPIFIIEPVFLHDQKVITKA